MRINKLMGNETEKTDRGNNSAVKEQGEADRVVEERIVRIKMTDGSMINGQVNIARSPGYERLSDLVEDRDNTFLVLFNATLYDTAGENPARHQTLFVNKTRILWIEPDEDQN